MANTSTTNRHRPISLKLPREGVYSIDSIERGFDVHMFNYTPHPEGGWTLSTSIGIVRLKTAREGALFCIAAAEAKRNAEKAAEAEMGG